jgi:antitoxin component YwqK of YwqJK toxin-antitoxin module
MASGDPMPDGGPMRDGKKHGRWRERMPRTEYRDGAFVEAGHWEVDQSYVDGVLQGPYTIWWTPEQAKEVGSHADGKRDGRLQMFARSGTLIVDCTMRAGEVEGLYTKWYDDGTLEYQCTCADKKRTGAYRSNHPDGRPHEEGAYAAGERDGHWRVWSPDGALAEEGRYAAGVRVGPWIFHRPGGARCEGEYGDGGALRGLWRITSATGVARTPRPCAAVDDLDRWENLEVCAELLASHAAEAAWCDRVMAAFTELARSWKVSTRTDGHGQRWASAPIDQLWQLRVAAGVPLHIVLRDELWSRILQALDGLPPSGLADAVALVEAAAGRLPTIAPRDWLTAILDGADQDPRSRLACKFEPGRTIERGQMERFRRRVPHLEELSLRECTFPDGLTPFFEDGFPALRRLFVVRSDTRPGEIVRLIGQLAAAPWPTELLQLAIVESGGAVDDATLAALLASRHLGRLRYLTLDQATLGAASAAALASGAARAALTSIDLRDCTLDHEALVALAGLPALEDLTLRRCALPALTTRAARAIQAGPALRSLTLADSLGVDPYAYGDKRSAYAVARRLSRVPALARLEHLDLSHNDLDDLAARVLARSPHLGRLRALDWTGNASSGDVLAPLREAWPEMKIQTAAGRGNVVVLSP